MSAFDDIKKQIAKEIESQQEQGPITVAGKDNTQLDEKGMPVIQHPAQTGTLVSAIGSETVMLDASTFQLMQCENPVKGRGSKTRCCIVEKGVPAKYGNQFINSAGERTHVITREVFNLLLGVLNAAGKQIADLKKDLNHEKEMGGLYKTTVESLRKAGVID